MKTKAFFPSTLYFSSLSFRLCSPLEQAALLTDLFSQRLCGPSSIGRSHRCLSYRRMKPDTKTSRAEDIWH